MTPPSRTATAELTQPLEDIRGAALSIRLAAEGKRRAVGMRSADPQTQTMVQALSGLQEWLLKLRAKGLATVRGDRLVCVEAHGADAFFVGRHEGRAFLGVAQEHIEWFTGMPWLHAAVKRGGARLGLVVEEVRDAGFVIPPMGLSLQADSPEQIEMLSRHHYLDVRVVDQMGGRVQVSKEIVMTLDLVLTGGDDSLAGLYAGRKSNGYTNRSVFRGSRR